MGLQIPKDGFLRRRKTLAEKWVGVARNFQFWAADNREGMPIDMLWFKVIKAPLIF